MRLSIKTKLAGAFGVVILLSMAAGGLAYFKLSDMIDTQTELVGWTKRLDLAGDMANGFQNAARAEKNAVISVSFFSSTKRELSA